MTRIRDATPTDLDALARIWYDAWQDAHAAILPEELRRIRTFENFHGRLQAALRHVRVAEAETGPVGFCITEGEELYQLFVSAAARGTGIAAALVADAEAAMAAAGGRDRLAGLRHRQRARGTLLREAGLAPYR